MKFKAAFALLLAGCVNSGAPEVVSAIHLDQVGYPSHAAKRAFVESEEALTFAVHDLADGAMVAEGTLGPPTVARDSGKRVREADFSMLTRAGTYEMRVGRSRSHRFTIGDDVHGEVLRLALRSFYGQRCGTAVDLGAESPGYTHPACHLEGAFHPSSGRSGTMEPRGGWHDAGDYGRYVVNSGIATSTLMWAWELFPEAFRALDLNIPESSDDLPDLLDEVLWNLRWMLSMQDSDGGVWHKQTSARFPAMVMPQDDQSVSLVVGTGTAPFKSTCATAELAATMAIAARVFAPFQESFSREALAAARSAWSWSERYPAVAFTNPTGIVTGEYGDGTCDDERLGAAAELFRTTGEPQYGQWLSDRMTDLVASVAADEPPSWNEVGALAAWTYALSGKGDDASVAAIRERSAEAAREIVTRADGHAFRIPLDTDDYRWGSNGIAANYGLQLLVANELDPNPAYRSAALDIVHYLLGRNPLSISWVTGVGSHRTMHPHHRPSSADGVVDPWPGLLAGGPNRERQDPAMRAIAKGTPPALMYLDIEESYATNEIAINWNAPFVLLLAGLR